MRAFAATAKHGDGKDKEANDKLRKALILYATNGSTGWSKNVLKTEVDACREAWKAYTEGRLVADENGVLIEVPS